MVLEELASGEEGERGKSRLAVLVSSVACGKALELTSREPDPDRERRAGEQREALFHPGPGKVEELCPSYGSPI